MILKSGKTPRKDQLRYVTIKYIILVIESCIKREGMKLHISSNSISRITIFRIDSSRNMVMISFEFTGLFEGKEVKKKV